MSKLRVIESERQTCKISRRNKVSELYQFKQRGQIIMNHRVYILGVGD